MKALRLGLLAALPLLAQHYEAASIKPSPKGDPRGLMEFLPGGRFRATNQPMLIVLATAFNVPYGIPETLRIKNLPDWAITTRYDIEATMAKSDPAAPVAARNERIRQMLQSVLADRLKLRIHRETVEVPIYAIVASPHGTRLEKSKIAPQDCAENAPVGAGTGCHQIHGGMGQGMHGEAVDMADLALYASNWSDRPILDDSKLTGLYNIQTEPWGAPILNDPARASLFEIFDRLGLLLASRKGPVEFWVIDHIEKPSEN